eukprot:scaffold208690_cov20-Tisochrysis_lutea.AAC.2
MLASGASRAGLALAGACACGASCFPVLMLANACCLQMVLQEQVLRACKYSMLASASKPGLTLAWQSRQKLP